MRRRVLGELCTHGSAYVSPNALKTLCGVCFLLKSHRAVTPEALDVYQHVVDRVRGRVMDHWGLSKLMLTTPSFFSQMVGGREARNAHDEYWHPHVDYEQYDGFCYTCLVYLNEHGKDYTGGRFMFDDGVVDSEEHVNFPHVVRPEPGLLSCFTSGHENEHHVERVDEGTRYAVTIAFTCDERKAVRAPGQGVNSDRPTSEDEDLAPSARFLQPRIDSM